MENRRVSADFQILAATSFRDLIERVITKALDNRLKDEMRKISEGSLKSSHWILNVFTGRVMKALRNPSDGDLALNVGDHNSLEGKLYGFSKTNPLVFHFEIIERRLKIEEVLSLGGWAIGMTFYEHNISSPDLKLQEILRKELGRHLIE